LADPIVFGIQECSERGCEMLVDCCMPSIASAVPPPDRDGRASLANPFHVTT
jgi:hypothetical protein